MTQLAYEQKKRELSQQLRSNDGGVRLEKSTSNLFRTRERDGGRKLDVSALNQVLDVDSENQLVEVEGMTTYVRLTDACLEHTCMPLVVPQLKSITIGGAVSGIGIESSSFRYGLPHESVLSMDILLADGEVVTCSPDNENADLFFGIPNSYGTLGYILKLTARTMPVKPFVALEHSRYRSADEYFGAVAIGPVYRNRPLYQRLHLAQDVFSLDPATPTGLSENTGLYLALGYRLVLVFQECLCAEPAAAPAARQATA